MCQVQVICWWNRYRRKWERSCIWDWGWTSSGQGNAVLYRAWYKTDSSRRREKSLRLAVSQKCSPSFPGIGVWLLYHIVFRGCYKIASSTFKCVSHQLSSLRESDTDTTLLMTKNFTTKWKTVRFISKHAPAHASKSVDFLTITTRIIR